MKTAERDRLISRSPCHGVSLPRVPRRTVKPITPEEVDRLVAATSPPYDVALLVLAWCGLRWGELGALRRNRIDLDRGTIDVREAVTTVHGKVLTGPTKTHQRRTVVIPVFLRDRLAEHLQTDVDLVPTARLFSSPQGGVLRYQNFLRRVWRPAVRAAGLGSITIHQLRHFCVSVMIAEGATALDIMKQVGHENIETTYNVYGHLMPGRQEDLAERLDGAYRRARVGLVWGSGPKEDQPGEPAKAKSGP
jgi:integrase